MLFWFPWQIKACQAPFTTRSSPRKTFTTTWTAHRRITVLKIAVFVFRSSYFHHVFALTTPLKAFGASSSTKRWSSWMRYWWGKKAFSEFPDDEATTASVDVFFKSTVPLNNSVSSSSYSVIRRLASIRRSFGQLKVVSGFVPENLSLKKSSNVAF